MNRAAGAACTLILVMKWLHDIGLGGLDTATSRLGSAREPGTKKW
jgi:hypothetical protein